LYRFVMYFLALTALLLSAACSEPMDVPVEPDHTVVRVETVLVKPGNWLRTFKSYGLVSPTEEFQIGVGVSATVKDVMFQLGQEIGAGDVLLKLDDKKLQLRLKSAQASVEEARAMHQQAKSTYERNQSIYRTGVISEQAYLQSEAKLKSSLANLQRTNAALDIASEELADAVLKSPVNGVVTRRDVEPGKNVSPIDNLGVIRVMGALRVETFVSQKDINHISVGMDATVVSPGVPGHSFSARVDRVASSAESSTGNFEVGVVIEDVGAILRDGMSAMVQFQGSPQQGVLAVPRSALIDRGRRLIVFRVKEDKAELVQPTVGVGNSFSVPVFTGLNAGDEIIVSNLRLISHGQAIQRHDADAAEAGS
jgi:RND family efflux transporter MFP subunit